MSQIGISITKQTLFRDSVQEFSNVYHYGSAFSLPSESDAESLIDELVAIEKTIHSTAVEFTRARCWSSGGTTAENHMIFEKNLSGTGAATNRSSLDRERAVLIQWRAGLDSRGHPVFLKKWYHTCGDFFTVPINDAGLWGNTSGFSSGARTSIQNKADEVTRLGPGVEEWGLVAASGRERDGDPPVAHRYLEHHQMGDQWRG